MHLLHISVYADPQSLLDKSRTTSSETPSMASRWLLIREVTPHVAVGQILNVASTAASLAAGLSRLRLVEGCGSLESAPPRELRGAASGPAFDGGSHRLRRRWRRETGSISPGDCGRHRAVDERRREALDGQNIVVRPA